MQSTTTTVTASDGIALHTHRWLPDGEAKAVVQIAHGVGEHSARYARLAEALTPPGTPSTPTTTAVTARPPATPTTATSPTATAGRPSSKTFAP